MRDPSRIPAIIAALQEAWLTNPDLRLGQLIDNAGYFNADGSNRAERGEYIPPVFMREDGLTLNGLRGIVARSTKGDA